MAETCQSDAPRNEDIFTEGKTELMNIYDNTGYNKGEFDNEEPDIEEGMEFPLPNLMDMAYQWTNAGFGLGQYDMVPLNLAIKAFVNSKPIKTAKLWGKMFGTVQNYYIVEAVFEDGEDEDLEEEEELIEENVVDQSEDMDSNAETKMVLPKSKWKSPPQVPKEANQTGINRRAYFVCHEPGQQWFRLPQLLPKHIVTARQSCSLLTGVLGAPVRCSPAFPGTEAHYLGAQIARISSCTQISPDGYFHFDDEAEEEEEDVEEDGDEAVLANRRYIRNEEYEPLPLTELSDSKMQHWVHHTPYILPQGRTKWWNPAKANEDDEMEELEEEDEELAAEPAQRGPPILSRVSADAPIFGQRAWSSKLSSKIVPEHACAVASSNIWSGAHAIAWEKQCDTVYVGFGLKSFGEGFYPYLPPAPCAEFKDDLTIEECTDPTPDEEAALRALTEKAGEEELGEEDEEDVLSESDENN